MLMQLSDHLQFALQYGHYFVLPFYIDGGQLNNRNISQYNAVVKQHHK